MIGLVKEVFFAAKENKEFRNELAISVVTSPLFVTKLAVDRLDQATKTTERTVNVLDYISSINDCRKFNNDTQEIETVS